MRCNDLDCPAGRNDGPVIRGESGVARMKGNDPYVRWVGDAHARCAPEAPLHQCTLHVLRSCRLHVDRTDIEDRG